ncbi:metal-dependent transcriptional regulator [Corynebacterium sp. H128]|uniref:metal-dependent transcriptional regulator n=1 Tax=Corynebacterium sp. H128 TaxID=3133427 RepID=UPI0030971064
MDKPESVSDLSASSQNYLKAVWGLQEWSAEPVTKSALAECVGVKLSTASDAVRKLRDQGLLNDTRYGAVTLTETGAELAVAMVRRHRLIELFLCEVLDYEWHEVHDEAEALEHAVSDLFVTRIAERLGFPERDPHGDPIPRADGSVPTLRAVRLSELGPGAGGVIERISDGDPELLRHLAASGIVINAEIEVLAGAPYSGTFAIRLGDASEAQHLSAGAANAIWVGERY